MNAYTGEGELNEYDSGGGHYIQNPADDLYYITGVYTYQYNEFVQLFTNLATHMEWINTIYEEIDPIDDNDFVEYEGKGKKTLSNTIPALLPGYDVIVFILGILDKFSTPNIIHVVKTTTTKQLNGRKKK